jgi:hypothetical protein
MVVSKLTDGLGHVEAGSKMIEDIDLNEQGAVTRQGIVRMHACNEEILEEKKRSLSLQTGALDSLKSTSGTCVSPPVLLDTANEDPDDLPTVNSQCLFLTY